MKQIDYEKELSVYTGMSLQLIQTLIRSLCLIVQDNIRNDIRTNIPRLGAVKRKVRAARLKYDIHSGMPVLFPESATAYMTAAGYQQQYFSSDYQPTKVFKETRTYPNNTLAQQLSTANSIDILTCNNFLVALVDTLIAVTSNFDKVSFRDFGTFYIQELTARPAEVTSPNSTGWNYFYSEYLEKWVYLYGASGTPDYALSTAFTSWKYIYLDSVNYMIDCKISVVSGIWVAIFQTPTERVLANSIDGKNWTFIGRPYDVGFTKLYYLASSDTFFMTSFIPANSKIQFSQGGLDWELYEFDETYTATAILVDDSCGYAVVVGNEYTGGTTYRFNAVSSNIAGWSYQRVTNSPYSSVAAFSQSLNQWANINFNQSLGYVGISANGLDWSPITIISGFTAHSITWSPELNLYVISGIYAGNVQVLISSTGAAWSLYDTGFTGQIRSSFSKPHGKKVIIWLYRPTGNLCLVSNNGIDWAENYGSYTRERVSFKPSRKLNLIAREGLTP